MKIVVEGPDNSGKSWLALRISSALTMRYQKSQGPEQWPGEMRQRVQRYLSLDDVVFDRHPCVSQNIYAFISGTPAIPEEIADRLYDTKPFVIYCRLLPGRGLQGHTRTSHADTDDYLKKLEMAMPIITKRYDEWALEHANLIYRIGDNPQTILHLLRGIKDGQASSNL